MGACHSSIVSMLGKHDKDAVLTLDEMNIKPGEKYDTSMGQYIGNVNLPGHDDTEYATKALVFMLAGVVTKWKQPVAYYLTTDKCDGSVFVDIQKEIMLRAKKIGLNVKGVVSDMGASNKAL